VTERDDRPSLAELAERPLTPEEFDRRLELARADVEQRARNAELIEWFMRRYPTPSERLAYIRRKHREWTRKPTR